MGYGTESESPPLNQGGVPKTRGGRKVKPAAVKRKKKVKGPVRKAPK